MDKKQFGLYIFPEVILREFFAAAQRPLTPIDNGGQRKEEVRTVYDMASRPQPVSINVVGSSGRRHHLNWTGKNETNTNIIRVGR